MRLTRLSNVVIGLGIAATAGALMLSAEACGEACHTESGCEQTHSTAETATTAGPTTGSGGGGGGTGSTGGTGGAGGAGGAGGK
jgi:hypothetical protein